MGLSKDIEDALWKAMGETKSTEVGRGNIPAAAKDITKAIIKYIKAQKFTITQMKAVAEMETIKTAGPTSANIAPTVMYISPAGAPVPLMNPGRGVMIPPLNFKKTGGQQGGVLMTKGYAYIGLNPISPEINDKHTQNVVKLLQSDKNTE